ncbi:hypothetical protein PSH58_10670 [Pseudomonas hefeiensis]|uniref:Receptor protein-tyrosine kinase n=1 Tax=Pseudomonas hefeiensis TaxID=2738125 RepID=A0ABY9GGJ1_9PSED|nr:MULTISPECIES: hypothetical protein [unclassified Pseudomonas]WLH14733.1 hypothetical protein PSH57_10650 [Pseudomonas sp. FP205]WLH97789.1 hypothetical protein PSH58_10670 [Pseudomonas sp. FP53]WLI42060.1 hypothetical protein PSH74_10635 [Pseudomonas sp. FP821]
MNRYPHQQGIKVHYSPLEAAIRWSNLLEQEINILVATAQMADVCADTLPLWPVVGLNLERLYDAMRNGDLPYGNAGITTKDPALLDAPGLTIRHVDLKQWMAKTYPDQKPGFLFDELERQLHPVINLDTVQALLLQIKTLETQLSNRAQHRQPRPVDCSPNLPPRAETTYLNIVGGLLTLLLGQSPSGVRYSSFNTLASVISALIAHHNGRPGITERTLRAKFAEAKRQLSAPS